jgi:NADH-quinone oxidoreductase subunit K
MNFIAILLIPFALFFIGIFGIFVNRKNILLVIICVELILLSVNFTFLLISFYLDDMLGQIFVIFILTVASAETSIGLAILVVYYRVWGTIAIDHLNILKN